MINKIDILTKNEKPVFFTKCLCCSNCNNCKSKLVNTYHPSGGIPPDEEEITPPEMEYKCKLCVVDAGNDTMQYFKTTKDGFCPRHSEYRAFKKSTQAFD